MTRTVRIPADVDRDDRLVAGLTARQLALLATVTLALAALWSATRTLVPLPVFLVAAAPLTSVAVVLAIGRRDGLPADRLALAAIRHARSNRRLVPAPEGVPALPAGAPPAPLPAPFNAPVDDIAPDGVLELGAAGCALVCRASSLNFGLRTDAEQQAVVAAFGRWLNSLSEPVQILVRAQRVDVSAAVAAVERDASALPSVDLEQAALDHARFLASLAARRDVLRRVVLVVFRSPQPDAGEVLARRAADAATALGAAGISVSALAEPDARALLVDAMNAATGSSPAMGTGLGSGGWQ